MNTAQPSSVGLYPSRRQPENNPRLLDTGGVGGDRNLLVRSNLKKGAPLLEKVKTGTPKYWKEPK